MRVGRGSAATGLVTLALLTSGCVALGKQAPLTFSIDDMECAPATSAGTLGNLCSFLAYYGNVGAQPVQVEPGTTTVIDKSGRAYTPVAEGKDSAAFLLRPGRQQGITWSVTLPVNAKPAQVQWHGSKAAVQLQVPSAQPSASVAPSASAVPSGSAAPSSAAPSPTPTTTKPAPKPTTHKPQPTHKATPTKTVKPTTAPPTTTPPPQTTPPVTITTRRPPVHHTTRPPAPTTNPTNPGGGSGGIG